MRPRPEDVAREPSRTHSRDACAGAVQRVHEGRGPGLALTEPSGRLSGSREQRPSKLAEPVTGQERCQSRGSSWSHRRPMCARLHPQACLCLYGPGLCARSEMWAPPEHLPGHCSPRWGAAGVTDVSSSSGQSATPGCSGVAPASLQRQQMQSSGGPGQVGRGAEAQTPAHDRPVKSGPCGTDQLTSWGSFSIFRPSPRFLHFP